MILQNLIALNFQCVKCIRTKPHSPQFSYRKSVLKSAAKVHTKNYLSLCTKHENLKVQLRDPYSWLKWSKCLPIFSWFLILANLTSSLNIMNKKKRKKKNLLELIASLLLAQSTTYHSHIIFQLLQSNFAFLQCLQRAPAEEATFHHHKTVTSLKCSCCLSPQTASLPTRLDAEQHISGRAGESDVQPKEKQSYCTVLKGQSGYLRDSSFYSGPSSYLK